MFIAAIVLVITAIFLPAKGFWGIFAFCCVNTPFLVVSVYLKDGRLRRFHDGLSSVSDFFWPLC